MPRPPARNTLRACKIEGNAEESTAADDGEGASIDCGEKAVEAKALQSAEQAGQREQPACDEVEGAGPLAIVDLARANQRAQASQHEQPDPLGINLAGGDECGCPGDDTEDEEREEVMRATMRTHVYLR
jgi:hypothetical protein